MSIERSPLAGRPSQLGLRIRVAQIVLPFAHTDANRRVGTTTGRVDRYGDRIPAMPVPRVPQATELAASGRVLTANSSGGGAAGWCVFQHC